jgi:hypothetical protein
MIADLLLGLRHFILFATESANPDQHEMSSLWDRAFDAFAELLERQNLVQAQTDPAIRFLQLISAALLAGRAHLDVRLRSRSPAQPDRIGWRRRGLPDSATPGGWERRGDCIGWWDGEIYLEPTIAHYIAQRMSSGEPFSLTEHELRRRLYRGEPDYPRKGEGFAPR